MTTSKTLPDTSAGRVNGRVAGLHRRNRTHHQMLEPPPLPLADSNEATKAQFRQTTSQSRTSDTCLSRTTRNKTLHRYGHKWICWQRGYLGLAKPPSSERPKMETAIYSVCAMLSTSNAQSRIAGPEKGVRRKQHIEYTTCDPPQQLSCWRTAPAQVHEACRRAYKTNSRLQGLANVVLMFIRGNVS